MIDENAIAGNSTAFYVAGDGNSRSCLGKVVRDKDERILSNECFGIDGKWHALESSPEGECFPIVCCVCDDNEIIGFYAVTMNSAQRATKWFLREFNKIKDE